jgi:hypothetical protein
MSFKTNTDNAYPVGTHIAAKEDPATRLVIEKYYQRIYYCSLEKDVTAKHRAYFERELIAPEIKMK